MKEFEYPITKNLNWFKSLLSFDYGVSEFEKQTLENIVKPCLNSISRVEKSTIEKDATPYEYDTLMLYCFESSYNIIQSVISIFTFNEDVFGILTKILKALDRSIVIIEKRGSLGKTIWKGDVV